MKLRIDDQMLSICKDILTEKKTEQEWAFIESSDMFQTKNYCGGYDATENAFCFSYYSPDEQEFWFQLTLRDVEKIENRRLNEIELFKPK